MKAKRGRIPGFTLIELLVVIGVIAVMMTLVIPAIKGPGDSQKLRSAADIVSTLGMFARQNSISKGAPTAIAILQGGTASEPEGKILRAASVFELKTKTDGSASQSADWEQLTPWKVLPLGTIIDRTESTFLSRQPASPGPALPANIKLAGVNGPQLALQIFGPDGRLMNDSSVSLKIVPGLMGAEGNIIQRGNGVNYITVSFIPSTGKTKVYQP